MSSVGGRKRKSSAKKRDNETDEDSTPVAKKRKGCDRRTCAEQSSDPPSCFCSGTDKCAGSGHSSRWYHLSVGQHYCNECFENFYRSCKPGNKLYKQWSDIWEDESGGRVPPKVSQFMADMWLPIYVQCTVEGCGRWRKLPAHIELHHVKLDMVTCNECSTPEDKAAICAKDPLWVHSIGYTPLLRYNEGLASLLKDYCPEGVGISPSTVTQQRKKNIVEEGKENGAHSVYDEFHPFNDPNDGSRAGAFTPDIMEDEELKTFPEWTKSPALEVYLIIRNIILSLWSADCTQSVTVDRCMKVLSLRGVVRVWCAQQLPRILHFMSRKGFVNHGKLTTNEGATSSPAMPLVNMHPIKKKSSVLIVGAGPAGIASARHLVNFGYDVTVLEASNRIGGRVCDDHTISGCGLVPIGAMFITGPINNPLTAIIKQYNSGALIRIKDDSCQLISEVGVAAGAEMDQKVEKHYNETLDGLSEWRKNIKDVDSNDASLQDKLSELHSELLSKSEHPQYTKDELSLLNFHYGNLEFACGATLDKVSGRYWDHNDLFDQYQGSHALVSCGLMNLLLSLCEDNIKFNSKVTNIEQNESKVIVKCTNGEDYTADKVIVTVPLSLLKANTISFSPSLSTRKLDAIRNLGAGVVEKIALCFGSPFWRSKALGTTDCDIFGHVSPDSSHRGLYGVFYDLSNTFGDPSNDKYLLMTTVSGSAIDRYNQLEDHQIIEQCMDVLKLLFPDKLPLPDLIGYSLSRWGRDPNAMMSYSFVSVGGSGHDYDVMSEEEMNGMVHFAGEATNRRHPQSVTGAYLSGIREAAKIIEHDYYQAMIH